MSTSTGLGGPPIVMLFAARRMEPKAFRASNGAYFLAIGLVALVLLSLRGMIESEHLWLAAVLVPASFVGKSAGAYLFDRLPRNLFRPMTLYLSLVAGIAGIAGTLLNFV